MVHDSTNIRVIDTTSGLPIWGMRFFNVPAVLDYLDNSTPACEACGSSFNRASMHSITNSDGAWQIRFPHDCSALLKGKTIADAGRRSTAPLVDNRFELITEKTLRQD